MRAPAAAETGEEGIAALQQRAAPEKPGEEEVVTGKLILPEERRHPLSTSMPC
jgi:hypothetical protein